MEIHPHPIFYLQSGCFFFFISVYHFNVYCCPVLFSSTSTCCWFSCSGDQRMLLLIYLRTSSETQLLKNKASTKKDCVKSDQDGKNEEQEPTFSPKVLRFWAELSLDPLSVYEDQTRIKLCIRVYLNKTSPRLDSSEACQDEDLHFPVPTVVWARGLTCWLFMWLVGNLTPSRCPVPWG